MAISYTLKILLVAFACHPEWGSESAAGWNTALLLAQEHHVHVITHPENRAAIESFQLKGRLRENLTFSFLGKPFRNHPNRMVARLMSWLLYKQWLGMLKAEFPKILKKERPDLIHHVTFATWRIGVPWHEFGLPVVWGPLGGAANFPTRFLSGLSLGGATFEIIRNLGTWIGRRIPTVIRCCRRSQAIICGNSSDAAWIEKIRGQKNGIHVLSSAHFSFEEMERFQKAGEGKDFDVSLRAFAGGICIGSKGIRFALEALALARREGTRVQYVVACTGPELSHLQKTVRRLNLQDQVQFHPGFRGAAYAEILGKSHLFLLPSFREGSPRTILEAMLAGAVPLVCAASAQGEIVGKAEGFAAPIKSRKELVQCMASAIVRLDRDRAKLVAMSQAAQRKVRENNSSDSFLRKIGEIYGQACDAAQLR